MIRALLLSAVLLLAGCARAESPNDRDHHMPMAEWNFVCTKLLDMGYDKVDCTKTPRPGVVVTSLVDAFAERGEVMYGFTIDGEPYIFINEAYPEGQMEVMVHEAVHYLLSETYGMTGMSYAISECESEDAARKVGSAYSGEEIDAFWKLLYGCTLEVR